MSSPSVPRRVGLATCSELPALDEEGSLLLERIRRRGLLAEPVVWDDRSQDWDAFDLIVLRSTWDWHSAPEAFERWARSLGERIINPLPAIEWNLSKRYLLDLDSWGIPIVPTTFIGIDEPLKVPGDGEFVLKPAMGAGSKDAARYARSESDMRAAGSHLARLHARSREAMVQPYFDAVDTDAETAVVFLGGAFSHAMRKGPLLELGGEFEEGLFKQEEMSRREPSPDVLRVAQAAVGAAEAHIGPTAYARVDLLPSGDGEPHVLELELIEPSLFLDFFPPGAEVFAEQIERRL